MRRCNHEREWNDFVKMIMDNDKLHAAYVPKIFVPRGQTHGMFRAAASVAGPRCLA